MSYTLAALKVQSEARLEEEKRLLDAKRALLVLILSHLDSEGYFDAQECLQRESGVSLSKFDVADNMDLNMVLKEFKDYHALRFSKEPKLIRRLGHSETTVSPAATI